MSERPKVSALLLAEVFERLPSRLQRRLEREPDLALGWNWTGERVRAGSEAEVNLRASTITSLDQVSCSCLLAPRCLHIAAVLRTLAIVGEASAETRMDVTEPEVDQLELDSKQRAAVQQMWTAGAAILAGGASAAGLVTEGELLRATHSCRLAGLHRLAAAGLRIVDRIRALRGQRPDFRLEVLTSDMFELLATARRLSVGVADGALVGTARREYHPIGSLKLAGLFTEPVIAATGHAGVVTYFLDTKGLIWSLADIAPGEPSRCQVAYRAAVDIGDVTVAHRSLGRRGLLLQRATASPDRRLGSGHSVGAVLSGSTTWSSEPLLASFSRPLSEQLDAAWEARVQGAGSDLLFIKGRVVGARENALMIETQGAVLGAFAPTDHDALPYRDNLRLLGSIPDLEVLAIGRIRFDHPASIHLLAVAPSRHSLPGDWNGRVNLGLDVLARGHLPASETTPPSGELALRPSDAGQPLDVIRRRLGQVLVGGRATISPVTWTGIVRDESMLTRFGLRTGARLLESLRNCGAEGGNVSQRDDRLARAWLVTSTYERTATAHIQRLTWLS